ncbi:MAG: hypothetical protein ACOYM7_06155 [Paludibacter sp.]
MKINMEVPKKKHFAEIEYLKSLDPVDGLSIIELTNYFKNVNNELLKAMNRITYIIDKNEVLQEDIIFLKSLDLRFYDRKLDDTAYLTFGLDIKRNILKATLTETYLKSQIFFEYEDNSRWDESLDNLILKLIKIGNDEIEFLLYFISELKFHLNNLHSFLKNNVYKVFYLRIDLYFEISYVIEAADLEPDLIKRKQIYIDAIIERDMFCLVQELNAKEEILYKEFIKKCHKAIDILDFKIQNSSNVLKSPEKALDSIPSDIQESTSTDIIVDHSNELKNRLKEYGFFVLPKVLKLNLEKQEGLMELLNSNKLPYCIAMLNFLDFIVFLDKKHFKTIKSRNIEIGKWFGSNERAVRGNINILIDYSEEDSDRYTAINYKDKVEIDYNEL